MYKKIIFGKLTLYRIHRIDAPYVNGRRWYDTWFRNLIYTDINYEIYENLNWYTFLLNTVAHTRAPILVFVGSLPTSVGTL